MGEDDTEQIVGAFFDETQTVAARVRHRIGRIGKGHAGDRPSPISAAAASRKDGRVHAISA
jgi:hypothetical protein